MNTRTRAAVTLKTVQPPHALVGLGWVRMHQGTFCFPNYRLEPHPMTEDILARATRRARRRKLRHH